MNYQKLTEKATQGPVHMDNCFMLCDSNEDYVAQIDATEDPEHRALATGHKLAHCYNHFDAVLAFVKAVGECTSEDVEDFVANHVDDIINEAEEVQGI